MLTCLSCGGILVSDGRNWTCPAKAQPYAHAPKHPPTVFADKRIGLSK